MTEYFTKIRDITYTLREKDTGIIVGTLTITEYGVFFEPAENSVFRSEDLKNILKIMRFYEKLPIEKTLVKT